MKKIILEVICKTEKEDRMSYLMGQIGEVGQFLDKIYDVDVTIHSPITILGCEHKEAVRWNPENKVVQCHKCGVIFIEKPFNLSVERKGESLR